MGAEHHGQIRRRFSCKGCRQSPRRKLGRRCATDSNSFNKIRRSGWDPLVRKTGKRLLHGKHRGAHTDVIGALQVYSDLLESAGEDKTIMALGKASDDDDYWYTWQLLGKRQGAHDYGAILAL